MAESKRLDIKTLDKILVHLAVASDSSSKLLNEKNVDENSYAKQLLWNQRAMIVGLEAVLTYIKNCKEDLGDLGG